MDHDRIVPLAKRAGLSSFTSLWEVKRALGTRKVGHTGTLDSFADGLLVVLAGRMTRFAPFITDMDKEYLALVRFGAETDTLDPEGAVVAEAPLPSRDAVEA
ncbi:MAG TPA: tRNA pseudouridine(55) synthase TruB, partial [Treponemataceae bacterium]|nr:tRNA pseudouridine(55) synthase TruB [Treponemataceae bacterium]